MAALNRAYATLSDPLARHVYDRDRQASGAPAPPFAPGTRYKGRPTHWASPASMPPPPSTIENPNGVGTFLGVLSLLLLLTFIGWSVHYGFGSVLAALVTLAAVAGLFVLAGLLFSGKSALARLAHEWLQGEPRGSRSKRAAARASYSRRPPHHGAKPGAAGATTTEADDPETRAAARFERLVDEALATVPPELAAYLENVVVRVEDQPSAEDLKAAHVAPGQTLLGLYHGVPLTHHFGMGAPPEVITIYRKPIERVSRNRPTRIRAQVRATVLHELAHHFGIDHDEMPSWVK